MRFFEKIKAGALQYVMVVSVIIAILIFAFISLIYLQQRISSKHGFAKEAIANTQMAFEYLKGNTLSYNKETILKFSDHQEAITTIFKKHWGIFDLAIVQSNMKNEFFQKIGLLGTQNSKREALFLKDNNQSLVLVGKTRITGNVSIPKEGVKSGNIAGTSYYGSRLIYGNQKVSSTQLPPIKNIKYVKDFYDNYNNDSLIKFELVGGLKIQQSFTKKTLLFEAFNAITLANMALRGHILVVSKTSITVAASAILEDVILIAPKIIIANNVKGNFQAIAAKNIEVGMDCKLRYPTAFVLIEKGNSIPDNKQQQKEENKIAIKSNTFLKGVLVYESESIAANYNAQISIQENAIITGEVYCNKNLELLGSVYGTIYTNNFIVKKSGGIYSNHIYNGIVNATKIPQQYVGLQINQASNAVAKWLD